MHSQPSTRPAIFALAALLAYGSIVGVAGEGMGAGSCDPHGNPAANDSCECLAPGFAAADLDASEPGACAAASEWSAPLDLRFSARCELHDAKYTPTCTWAIVERRALGCPCGALDGLGVKYGRTEKDDFDLYDFAPQCAGKAGQWAGLHFRATERYASAHLQCPDGDPITGLEVTYARYEWGDADHYDFKLKCANRWMANSTALHHGARRRRPRTTDTKSVQCPDGSAACGFEVTRARQEDGDLDQLDFRLRCNALTPALKLGGGIGERQGGAAGEGEALELEDAPAAGLAAVGSDEASPEPEPEPEPVGVGEEALELEDAPAAGLAAAAPQPELDAGAIASAEPAGVGRGALEVEDAPAAGLELGAGAAAGAGISSGGDSRDEL
ncbi:hypothetical protein T492DRAFT_1045493 [Pavlovales sp. CCMP2436]|nr:hypothetical protein T492DRAFT_1045493 [Pavlovales sp. CCMP2436]|mmetsp:Transcript_43025/g.106147  ORF Transcript_43025/g.106147 Transcript_43025/m.106147 type:complete len:386 (-) Transcript_43025:119-1276(-)